MAVARAPRRGRERTWGRDAGRRRAVARGGSGSCSCGSSRTASPAAGSSPP